MKIAIMIAISRRVRTPKPEHPPERHTPACEYRRQAYARWVKAWPNHCPSCHGVGEVSYDDDPGASDCSLSAGSMTFTDPCECVEEGRCPRCGKRAISFFRRPLLAAAERLRDASLTLGWNSRRLPERFLSLALVGLREPARRFAYACASLILEHPGDRLGAWLYELGDRLAASPEAPPACDHCGWTGHGEGDHAPYWECSCYEEHEAKVATQLAAGELCWRCERPIDTEHPAVRLKVPIFGERQLHRGCVLDGDRLIDQPEPNVSDDPTTDKGGQQ